MTPDLIALVLSLPLPVRLALLDAEPEGAGWFIPDYALDVRNCYVATHVTPHERGRVHDGAAWLPCNPLAIAHHAVVERGSGRLVVTHDDGIGWRFDIMEVRQGEDLPVCSAEDKCPHTAAIALLREVVG